MSVEEIVEARAAGRLLQAVDAAEAAIVEQHDDELDAEHDRGRDLRIHHEIGAVADHHDDLAVGLRHLHADAAGDLVAHAGIAVFEMVGGGRARLPQLVQFARQAAGGADIEMSRPSARCTAPITCASEGSALVAAVTASASFIQAVKPSCAASVQAAGAL